MPTIAQPRKARRVLADPTIAPPRRTAASPSNYFYIADAEFGLHFIKLCAYFPYPGKVWVNGHEWAKRQAQAEGLGFTELANGFASCADPAHLQTICDRLGPDHHQAFFDRWMTIIPTPPNDADQQAGYWWELPMRQVETSRTLVFDAPRQARGFFEALVVDNLNLGRAPCASRPSATRPPTLAASVDYVTCPNCRPKLAR